MGFGQPSGVVPPVPSETTIEPPNSREILRLTEQFGHIGFWRVDLETKSIFWSDEVFTIHGCDPALGPPALEDAILAYHPDDVPKVHLALDAAMRTGEAFEFHDARIVRTDGSVRRVYSRGECRVDDNGRAVELVGIFQDVTREFESRQLAVEASERLKLLTASGLSLWQYNVEDNTVLVSIALRRLLGIDADEPITIPLDDFIKGMPEEDQASVWQTLFNHVRADIPYLIEHRANHADGHILWLRSRGIAERDSAGRAIRVVGTVEDITQRKADEQALEEAHSRFDLAVAGASVGIWEVELPSGRMFVSDRLKEIVGAPVIPSEEEADRFVWKPETFLSNIHEEDRPRIARAIEGHLARGDVFREEYRFRHSATGQWIDVMIRGQAEWDAKGRPVRMAGSLEDISERTRSLAALADSEERFNLAVAGASVGIWDWNVAQETVYWSPLFSELLGYEASELTPSLDTFRALLHPEDVERTFELVEQHFAEGVPFSIEYRLKQKTDGYRWFYGSGKTQFAPDGTPLRMVGSIQDIHDRKVAEDQLLLANQDLQRYASVVSHDLQEPLRKITQFSSLLKTEAADRLEGDAQLYLDYLTDGATRMAQLIRDLLEFSRLGEEAMNVSDITVAATVEDVCGALQGRIEESGARITTTGSGLVEADPVLFRQLMQNLLSNALKFRSERQPDIEVAVTRDAAWDRVTVRDNGIGFEPEFSDKIFEMFGRLHRRDEIAGSGVGLAMCQRIADLHGGRITCASVPGEGAEFTVSFPRRPAELAA